MQRSLFTFYTPRCSQYSCSASLKWCVKEERNVVNFFDLYKVNTIVGFL